MYTGAGRTTIFVVLSTYIGANNVHWYLIGRYDRTITYRSLAHDLLTSFCFQPISSKKRTTFSMEYFQYPTLS